MFLNSLKITLANHLYIFDCMLWKGRRRAGLTGLIKAGRREAGVYESQGRWWSISPSRAIPKTSALHHPQIRRRGPLFYTSRSQEPFWRREEGILPGLVCYTNRQASGASFYPGVPRVVEGRIRTGEERKMSH